MLHIVKGATLYVMTTEEIKNELELSPLYARQASKPEWYDEAAKLGIAACATSGSSPFNEWYAFKDRAAVLDYAGKMFNSQSFVDAFSFAGSEIYRTEDLNWNDDSEEYSAPEGVSPASLGELVWAESKF